MMRVSNKRENKIRDHERTISKEREPEESTEDCVVNWRCELMHRGRGVIREHAACGPLKTANITQFGDWEGEEGEGKAAFKTDNGKIPNVDRDIKMMLSRYKIYMYKYIYIYIEREGGREGGEIKEEKILIFVVDSETERKEFQREDSPASEVLILVVTSIPLLALVAFTFSPVLI